MAIRSTRSPDISMQILIALLAWCVLTAIPVEAAARVTGPAPKKKPAAAVRKTPAPAVKVSRAPVRKKRPVKPVYNPWKEPTYADSAEGDDFGGDDPVVRKSAIEALGPLNGSVVAVEAATGRVLTVVNQKVAFKPGFTPCSTIKPFVGMGGLNENLVERETIVKISTRVEYNLTEALAKSDNSYFALLGQRLGFEKVSYYAKLFGLGERAASGIAEERPGTLPKAPPANGGVGMMSSFGEGIRVTPLQLAAAMAAIANGGTLHYLQYPRSGADLDKFVPSIKRQLGIEHLLGEIKPGLVAAVDHGTARRASWSQEETILGKTGTCTDQWSPTHLGWFASFNDSSKNKIAVVVLLTGGRPINGPVASDVAGKVYRSLTAEGYFQQDRTVSPVALVTPRQCCL